jgi:hypothetical protein
MTITHDVLVSDPFASHLEKCTERDKKQRIWHEKITCNENPALTDVLALSIQLWCKAFKKHVGYSQEELRIENSYDRHSL